MNPKGINRKYKFDKLGSTIVTSIIFKVDKKHKILIILDIRYKKIFWDINHYLLKELSPASNIASIMSAKIRNVIPLKTGPSKDIKAQKKPRVKKPDRP